MSATNRGAKRLTNNAFNTPPYAIEGFLEKVQLPWLTTFLEPCRGKGHIYDRISCHRRLHCEIEEGNDYLTWQPPCHVDAIVTNPPFPLALEFLQKSLHEAKFVAYLLPFGFFASQGRKEFWLANKPTHSVVLSKRPCFAWYCKGKGREKSCGFSCHPEEFTECPDCGGRVGPGTDSVDYNWVVWDRLGYMKIAPGMDWI
jgi:hypothetical protein